MNPYVIKRPLITEKTVQLAKQDNTYSFEVVMTANKNQIKETIEKLYPVRVTSVRTVTLQPGVKRTGRKRIQTATTKTKKALVTLKSGDTIPLFDIGGNE